MSWKSTRKRAWHDVPAGVNTEISSTCRRWRYVCGSNEPVCWMMRYQLTNRCLSQYAVFGDHAGEHRDARSKTAGFWEVFEENRWSKSARKAPLGQGLTNVLARAGRVFFYGLLRRVFNRCSTFNPASSNPATRNAPGGRAAKSVLLMTNRSDCVTPGPPFRGTFSPPATSMT